MQRILQFARLFFKIFSLALDCEHHKLPLGLEFWHKTTEDWKSIDESYDTRIGIKLVDIQLYYQRHNCILADAIGLG